MTVADVVQHDESQLDPEKEAAAKAAMAQDVILAGIIFNQHQSERARRVMKLAGLDDQDYSGAIVSLINGGYMIHLGKDCYGLTDAGLILSGAPGRKVSEMAKSIMDLVVADENVSKRGKEAIRSLETATEE